MFTLGYTFRPWTSDASIADGAAIRGYIRDTARDEGILPRIRFGHRVKSDRRTLAARLASGSHHAGSATPVEGRAPEVEVIPGSRGAHPRVHAVASG